MGMTFALSLHRACIHAINKGEQHHEENKLCGGLGIIDSDPHDRRVPVNDNRNTDDRHEWDAVGHADDGNERDAVGNADDRNQRDTVGNADHRHERNTVGDADHRDQRHTDHGDAVRDADLRHANFRHVGHANIRRVGDANVRRRSIRDDRRLDGWRQRVARVGIRRLEFRCRRR